jgi:polyisoprenyl-phosphate glycosyltransferase
MAPSGTLSIVIPVYNEATNLRPLYEELVDVLARLGMAGEMIFVDDGSRDGSLDALRRLAAEDRRVKVIALSRNFGHQYAVTAGVEHAQGDAVVVMDADLQHPPALIPAMVAQWRAGAQVVYTVRTDGEHTGWMKRSTSATFYKLINAISDTPIVPGAADFRLMDRQVVDCLVSMRERSRFLRGMVSWVGFRQVGLPYVANPRRSGRSKYSLRKMIALALEGITSFSSLPLRISAYLGFLASVSVLPYAVWAVYARLFTDSAEPGWASILVAELFLGGVQLMSIGIIGEYVGRIYTEVKGRPLYVAEELIGFDQPSRPRAEGQRTEHLQGPHFPLSPVGYGQTTHR